MKYLLIFVLIFPFAAIAQKVKVNEYDKFIKQRRIELEPLSIISSRTANIALTFKAIGPDFYLLLSGFGWGASTIDDNNQVIFLLSNDSTVTLRSTGIQSYIVGVPYNSYKHQYFVTLPDLEELSRYDIVGIRKYSFNDFDDITLSKENAVRIKKSSFVFIEELKKAKVVQPLKNINMTDVSKHIGDSVSLCSKVFGIQYIGGAADKQILLNLGGYYPHHLLTAVIREQDKKRFNDKPDLVYNNKEVCLSGIIECYYNEPRIVLYRKEQISLKTPIRPDEASYFVGDSVILCGRVATVNSLPDMRQGGIILYMSTPQSYPTLIIDIRDSVSNKYPDLQGKFFTNKEIMVKGRILLVNGKSQITINNSDQIRIRNDEAAALKGSENYIPVAEAIKYEQETKKANLSKTDKSKSGPKTWISYINQHILQNPSKKKEKIKINKDAALKQ
ncbi:MAG: hypothetical protein ICV81_08245 [Flavisolibacter sp.]|nr:hypothetical protein [Flavisolibacter sp.]